MSLDDNTDIKPRPEIWEKAVIVVAALLTLCGLGAAFFSFTIKTAKPPVEQAEPAAAPATPGEVTVGIYPKKPK